MKKILILGGTGYIGDYLSSILSDTFDVEIIGTKTEKKFVIGEDFDPSIIDRADIVLYLSWYFDLSDKKYVDKNVSSFRNVSELCKQNNINLVFFSTYFASNDSLSTYNKTKALCESIALKMGNKVVRLGAVILNNSPQGGIYGNVYKFVNKFNVFPVIFPNRKKFHLTNSNDLIQLCKDLRFLEKDVNFYCSTEKYKFYDLFDFHNQRIFKIYIHWRLIYLFLLFCEYLGIKLKFHSQNLVSIWGE